MNKKKIILIVLLSIPIGIFSQEIAIKTNALYWATTTPNLAMEIGLGKKTTFEVLGTYNPWTFSDNKKLKHWMVQPEFRYWFCERFTRHFVGVHAHYAYYNVGGLKLPFGWAPKMREQRYQGRLFGGGVSYGYQWILSPRWSLEASIGVGYARLIYNQYECKTCGEYKGKKKENYIGPTKATISLIYVIK